MENCKEITECLCCESDNLRLILDLGNQSPANNYNVRDKFPLRLNVCLNCSHAQLSHAVDPEILFRDYPYMSGVSETMKKWYKEFADITKRDFPNTKTVLEIGCNDGSQLDAFKKLGYDTYGIDPAQNLIEISRAKGHEVSCKYLDAESIFKFDVIIAQNVLAHNDNPYKFLQHCTQRMHNYSVLIIQTSQAKMIENHQFDTIYHEHINFFNKRSFTKLFNRCDLEIISHQLLKNIHGGSDLYILKKMPEISIQDYSEFSNRCYKFAKEFKIRFRNEKILIYGAAAKMINLVRFTGIEPFCFIEDTPTKIGQYVDGIPIHSSIILSKSDGMILPVWNFYDEIKTKVEKEYPGKFQFIKYIPEIIIE